MDPVPALAPLVEAGLAVLLLAVGAVALGGFLAYRYVLRRWLFVRDHVVTRAALATWDGVRAARLRRPGHAAGSSGRWSPTRARREIWKAVGAADQSLEHARQAGAPTAELPSLLRRLHQSAAELDRLLTLDPGAPSLRPQVEHLLAAASDIRRAAVDAAGDVAAPQIRELAADAEREFLAIREGLARSRPAI